MAQAKSRQELVPARSSTISAAAERGRGTGTLTLHSLPRAPASALCPNPTLASYLSGSESFPYGKLGGGRGGRVGFGGVFGCLVFAGLTWAFFFLFVFWGAWGGLRRLFGVGGGSCQPRACFGAESCEGTKAEEAWLKDCGRFTQLVLSCALSYLDL